MNTIIPRFVIGYDGEDIEVYCNNLDKAQNVGLFENIWYINILDEESKIFIDFIQTSNKENAYYQFRHLLYISESKYKILIDFVNSDGNSIALWNIFIDNNGKILYIEEIINYDIHYFSKYTFNELYDHYFYNDAYGFQYECWIANNNYSDVKENINKYFIEDIMKFY
jgi:hypothetical protein